MDKQQVQNVPDSNIGGLQHQSATSHVDSHTQQGTTASMTPSVVVDGGMTASAPSAGGASSPSHWFPVSVSPALTFRGQTETVSPLVSNAGTYRLISTLVV